MTVLSTSVTINILGTNDAPTITSNGGGDTATVSILENTTAVTTVTATDPDAGQTLSYSITGGADASKFTIGSATGALSFITAPNFELPTDAGGNNVYDVTVQVSDGHGGIDTQAIAATVTDVFERPPVHNFDGINQRDFLWQHDSGQAAVWLMNGTKPDRRWRGRAQPSGPSWHLDQLRRFQRGRPQRFSVAERQRPSRRLADEWNKLIGGGAVGPNPGPSWHVIDSGDFNADGHAAIFCGRTTTAKPPSG